MDESTRSRLKEQGKDAEVFLDWVFVCFMSICSWHGWPLTLSLFCGPHYSLCLTLQTYTAESRLGFWTSLVFQLAAVICQLSSWLLGAPWHHSQFSEFSALIRFTGNRWTFCFFLFFLCLFVCVCLFVLEKRNDDSLPLSTNAPPKVRKHTNGK